MQRPNDYILTRLTAIEKKLYQPYLTKKQYNETIKEYDGLLALFHEELFIKPANEKIPLINNNENARDVLIKKIQSQIDRVNLFFKSQKENHLANKSLKQSNVSPQHSNLPIIPPDILRLIFQSIDPDELHQFKLVCRAWRNVINKIKLPIKSRVLKVVNEYIIINIGEDETEAFAAEHKKIIAAHLMENKQALVDTVKEINHADTEKQTSKCCDNLAVGCMLIFLCVSIGLICYTAILIHENQFLGLTIPALILDALLTIIFIGALYYHFRFQHNGIYGISLGDNIVNFFKDRLVERKADGFFAQFRKSQDDIIELAVTDNNENNGIVVQPQNSNISNLTRSMC